MNRAGWVSTAILTAAAAFAQFSCFALEPGRRIPDIHVEKWYFEDAPKPETPASDDRAGRRRLDVIMIFEANAPGSFAFLKLLESVKASNPAQTRDIKAIARNNSKQLDEFFARNGQLSFPVGSDTSNSATYKDFCDTESILPMAFVVYEDGTLAWSGHPTGIEAVMKRIDEGSFDASSQRKISILRGELQTALQSGLGAVVLKNADRILALDPGDMIAIQAKLFIYENQGRFKEARDFLTESCVKCPADPEIRLTYLGLLLRAGDMDAYKADTAKCFADFKGKTSFLPKFASFIMDNSPFGEMPVNLALESAKSYMASLDDNSPKDTRAYANELLARANYYSCRQFDAIGFQSKALELRKGGPYEVPAAKLLDFYKGLGQRS